MRASGRERRDRWRIRAPARCFSALHEYVYLYIFVSKKKIGNFFGSYLSFKAPCSVGPARLVSSRHFWTKFCFCRPFSSNLFLPAVEWRRLFFPPSFSPLLSGKKYFLLFLVIFSHFIYKKIYIHTYALSKTRLSWRRRKEKSLR